MKILMVCLGNICRSPLAEGILQQKADKAGLDWKVDSAGTGNWHIGEAPHKLSQKVALLNGIDICQQKGRQFRASDMIDFDKIYFMDEENFYDAKRAAGKYWDEVKADLILNEIYPGQNLSVPDPWYGGEDGFHDVYEMLDKACEAVIRKYQSNESV